jgi:hypothetical protein
LGPKDCVTRCRWQSDVYIYHRMGNGCYIVAMFLFLILVLMYFCFGRVLQHSTRGLFRNPRVGMTSSSQLQRHSGWSLALGRRCCRSARELETSPRVASLLPLCLLPWYSSQYSSPRAELSGWRHTLCCTPGIPATCSATRSTTGKSSYIIVLFTGVPVRLAILYVH